MTGTPDLARDCLPVDASRFATLILTAGPDPARALATSLARRVPSRTDDGGLRVVCLSYEGHLTVLSGASGEVVFESGPLLAHRASERSASPAAILKTTEPPAV